MAKKLLYKSVVIKGFEELEKKQNAQVEQADVSVLASTEDTDRDQEVIKQDGIDLKHFKKNPVILFAHKYSETPIGRAINTKITDAGLQIDIKFASKKANPLGQQVKELMKEGILKAVSIGFIPKERDENNPAIITKSEMLELSIVPVPANPHALALAVKKGFSTELFKEIVKKKKIKKSGHDKPKKPKKDAKTPACRMEGESQKDCRSRKISELVKEGMEQDQAVAVAISLCKERCDEKGVKNKKNNSTHSERVATEPKGKKEPIIGDVERSHNALGLIVELPRSVVVDLRKETLKAYKQNELVLTMTKSILHKMNEENKKSKNK